MYQNFSLPIFIIPAPAMAKNGDFRVSDASKSLYVDGAPGAGTLAGTQKYKVGLHFLPA